MASNRDNEELFKCLKQLLDVFDEVCSKYDLTYTLFAGTLLGAIRHKGFIPWDDDLDIAMPRSDYDKLLNMTPSPFKDPYFLQTPVTDKGYHKGFAKLRNSDTTEIPYKDAAFEYNHGAFIDIFPLDSVPSNAQQTQLQMKRIKKAARLQHFTGRYYGKVGTLRLDNITKIAYYLMLPLCRIGIITSANVFKKLNKEASAYKDDLSAPYIGSVCFSFDNPRFIYDKKDYEELVNVEFEGGYYPAPKGYDHVLKKSYGDYMTPIQQKSEHGDTIIELHTPYETYVSEHKREIIQLFLENV